MLELNRNIVTTQWVLLAVGNFLRKESQRARFAPFVERLTASPYVTILPAESASFNAGMKLYDDRPDKAWSLTDCISFVVIRDHKIQDALTTDHHFNQAGFNALLA
jgi:predicted nucleic acid-binding protein